MVTPLHPVVTAAYELKSDRPVRMTLAYLKVQLETEGEAGVEQVVAAAEEHWELAMAHCAFAEDERGARSESAARVDSLPTYRTSLNCLEEHGHSQHVRANTCLYQMS